MKSLFIHLFIALAFTAFSSGSPAGICLHAYSPEAPNDKIESFEFARVERVANGYRFFLEPEGSVIVTNYRYRGMIQYFEGLTPESAEFDRLLKQYEATGRSTPSTRRFLNPKIINMRYQATSQAAEQQYRAGLPKIQISGKTYLEPRFKLIENGVLLLSHKDGVAKINLDEITDDHLNALKKIDPKADKTQIRTIGGKRLWNPSFGGISSNTVKIKHGKGTLEIKFDQLTADDKKMISSWSDGTWKIGNSGFYGPNPDGKSYKEVILDDGRFYTDVTLEKQVNKMIVLKTSKSDVTIPIDQIASLANMTEMDAAKVQAWKAVAGDQRDFEIAPGVKITMCWIPPGEFMMGATEGEAGLGADETQHRVKISKGFWLAKTETTQAQWQAVMGNNPSEFKGKDLPVERVSWNDIAGEGGFMHKLNQLTGGGNSYSLPTEAQWEYACRAGTTGHYAGELHQMAWYIDNSGEKTHPVGKKQPNAWGLHDMHGNVSEWCADWFGEYPTCEVTDPQGADSNSDSRRVYRGGSWDHYARGTRCAYRSYDWPSYARYYLGFRLARSSVP